MNAASKTHFVSWRWTKQCLSTYSHSLHFAKVLRTYAFPLLATNAIVASVTRTEAYSY
jgi:hypothetical protein